MAFPASSVSFPGIGTCLGGEFTLSRGVQPSICTLWLLPQETLDLAPGTLTFTDGGSNIEFPDAAPDLAFLRKYWDTTNQRWSLQIYDRRWRWKYGSVSGFYNPRLSNGRVPSAYRKNAQELAVILLDAMGEVGYSADMVPTAIYPYVNWTDKNPAQALQELCDQVACEVVLGLDNRVVLWPAGVGPDPPLNSSQRHQRFRLKPRQVPGNIIVRGGPDVYQSKFLLEAIGRESGGDHELIDDLSYAPTWTNESPWSFPSVTDDDDRAAAFDTAWRWFRMKQLAQGGLIPEGCPVAVTEVGQMLPLFQELIESFKDLDDVDRAGYPYIEGYFWNYADTLDNQSDKRYGGGWRLATHMGIIETVKPVLYLDSSGNFSTPVLNLTAAFQVKDGDGQFARLEEIGAALGTGDLALQHPELFQSFRTTYDGSTVTGVVSNTDEVIPEAQAYVQAFQQKFLDPWAWEMEYAGFLPVEPNGQVAQVKWSCHVNRPTLTHVSFNAEFDVHNLSDKQRRVYAAAG